MKLNNIQLTKLKSKIIVSNEAYRRGEPIISDLAYDKLLADFQHHCPDDEIFSIGIFEKTTERMGKLPVPMFSLEKIKEIRLLSKWLHKMKNNGAKYFCLTPKYDGISLVVEESTSKAWTRGDGTTGQKSDIHFVKMNSDHICQPLRIITWGEAVFKKKIFQFQKENTPNFTYKSARNLVAGIFNSPNGYSHPNISTIDYVRYGMNIEKNKSETLFEIRRLCENAADYEVLDIDDLLELTDEELNDFINEVIYPKFSEEYFIDGIVIEVDDYEIRKKLDRLPNGNPAYAVAFKQDSWSDVYQTRVDKIEYGVGKDGTLNPVIVVKPVEMESATISRVSGYNSATIIDRKICPGALIEIIRSGEVIPKHLKTLEYDPLSLEKEMDDMIICPSCGGILRWNESQVDLICLNEFCKEKNISKLVYFFNTMGCVEFEEPTLRKIYEKGFIDVFSIIGLHKMDLQNILGKSKGGTVFDQIDKIKKGVPLARYMAASNVFNGKIGEVTCQKIFDNYPEKWLNDNGMPFPPKKFEGIELSNFLKKINGIGDIIAETFVTGLYQFKRDNRILINYCQTPAVETEDGFDKMYVCFTEFRDKFIEDNLIRKGHVILKGVTKQCTILVTGNIDSNSSKMQSAQKKGIKIVTKETFLNEIFLQR